MAREKLNSPGGETRCLKQLFVRRAIARLRVSESPACDWIYEVKFDGYRALAFETGSEVQLFSRNRKLFNQSYPVLANALESLNADYVIDGEITAPDQNGRTYPCRVPPAWR